MFGFLATALAQERPPLWFRENWKETPAATPLTQDHVANPDLVLTLHGPGKDGIKKSHHDKPADDPYYVWSGMANGNWAVSLRHRQGCADLRALAKVRWRSKQAGFRQLRLIVQSGGEWMVADAADGPSEDWRVAEFNMADLRWRRLDIERVMEGPWVQSPDLSQVCQVGFTDLMQGGGSVACSRLDWIEVYAHKLSRKESNR